MVSILFQSIKIVMVKVLQKKGLKTNRALNVQGILSEECVKLEVNNNAEEALQLCCICKK